MQGLFNNTDFSDITFIVEGNEIKAHKCILALKSEYLKTLFRFNGTTDRIEIKDQEINFKSFSKIIKFIYTEKIDFDEEDFSKIAKIADIYLLDSLQKECCKKLLSLPCEIFLQSFSEIKTFHYLKEQILIYIGENWDSVFASPILYEDVSYLREILTSSEVIDKIKPKKILPPQQNLTKTEKDEIKEYLLSIQKSASQELKYKIADVMNNDGFYTRQRVILFCNTNKIDLPSLLKDI